MARPPEFDRAQALVRALHLFWEKSYERTAVRDLTEVVGISAPSRYNAFGSKQQLFDEAVAEYPSSPSRVSPPGLRERKSRAVFAKILQRTWHCGRGRRDRDAGHAAIDVVGFPHRR